MNDEIIDEVDDDNMVTEIDKKEQTIVIPIDVSETNSCKIQESEKKSEINLNKNEPLDKSRINHLDNINSINPLNNLSNIHNSEKNINNQFIHVLNRQNLQSYNAFINDTLNKTKQKIELDDKTVNYNQKFFDYKTLHKEKEKQTINLKTKHDSSDYIANYKRIKNDWIKKETEGVKKTDSTSGINSIDLRQEYKSLSDKKQSEAKNNKLYKYANNDNGNNSEILDSRKLIEMKLDSTPAKETLARLGLDSNFNSEKKIESSQLSLAFETELNSKEKLQINNNFTSIPQDPGKKSTRFSDFLKMKEEKNINISKIKETMQMKEEKRNSYELDLCTLEETFDDFYDLKPKNPVNKTKRNPILNIPADYKSNSSSNVNLKTSTFIANRNGIVRNKKEREKMNGYKCEICESVRMFYNIIFD
jgi:hypothetical protein